MNSDSIISIVLSTHHNVIERSNYLTGESKDVQINDSHWMDLSFIDDTLVWFSTVKLFSIRSRSSELASNLSMIADTSELLSEVERLQFWA